MKCPSCAANYDDNFSFCPFCGTGKPQPLTVRLQVEEPVPVRVVEPRYEYCDIRPEEVRQGGWFRGSVWKVVARGTGLNEATVYAESPAHGVYDSDKSTKYWHEMRRRLLQEGWDEVPDNLYKLRRRVA